MINANVYIYSKLKHTIVSCSHAARSLFDVSWVICGQRDEQEIAKEGRSYCCDGHAHFFLDTVYKVSYCWITKDSGHA